MAEEKTASDGKPVRFLIVDPAETISASVQSQYLEAKRQIGASAPSPTYVDTVRAAQGKLSDRAFEYSAVFVNPSLGVPGWFAVVRSCHQYRTGVPVFVVFDEKAPPTIKASEARKLGLSGMVAKPLTYAKMYELISSEPDDILTPFQEDQSAVPPTAEPTKKEDEIGENDVVEVDLREMAGRAKSVFDLYVRLSNQKYVKIVKIGDVLSADRVESYLAKGVKALYILKSAQQAYLDFYDRMVADVLKDANVKIETKTTQVASQGQSALMFLRNSGFSDQSVAAAQQYVSNTTELVKQIAAKNAKVEALLSDVASFEHSLAITTMAGIVIRHIGGQAPVINAIGLACFLHDVALVGESPEMLDENESTMTPEQLKTYHAHPTEGAKIAKKMKSVPPVAVQAIAQHHLRNGKKGFPSEAAVSEVNRIAELIGLCHEFLKLIRKSNGQADFDAVKTLKETFAKDYSAQLIDAFVRAFEEQ